MKRNSPYSRETLRICHRLGRSVHLTKRGTATGLAFALLLLGFFLVHDPVLPDRVTASDREQASAKTSDVSVAVYVTDKAGHPVNGLKKEDFRVYENGVEREVADLHSDDAPVSWGLVLDHSESMRGVMDSVYHAATHMIDGRREDDEMFIVAFNESVHPVIDFTSNRSALRDSVSGLIANGLSAWYDAALLALDMFKHAKHQKKALVIIADGRDDASRSTFKQLTERAKQENVVIYSAGMIRPMNPRELAAVGGAPIAYLEKLAEITGGSAHFTNDPSKCEEKMRDIAEEVSHQYRLSYRSTNQVSDGAWRSVRVVASASGIAGRIKVRTRAGHFAPREESR